MVKIMEDFGFALHLIDFLSKLKEELFLLIQFSFNQEKQPFISFFEKLRNSFSVSADLLTIT